MSQVFIHNYLSELDRIRAASGSNRESVVREAFKDLLKGWGRQRDLVFIAEHEHITPTKDRCYVDGALLHEIRVPFGYWEAKDTDDDLDAEIDKKKRKGYPQDNIIFEDSRTQFGGAFGGAAGPVRGVAARTCDLLPTAARVAEILHPTLDLKDRVGRLTIRLTYGVPPAAVDLAREAGANLLRGDYCRLAKDGLCEPEAIAAADEATLLSCLDSDKKKLALLREATLRIIARRAKATALTAPLLDTYVA